MTGTRLFSQPAQRLSRAQVDYQVSRHLGAQMQQWPHADRDATRARIRRSVTAGQSWLWPMPQQFDLFNTAGASHA